jgi:hypothetical protein
VAASEGVGSSCAGGIVVRHECSASTPFPRRKALCAAVRCHNGGDPRCCFAACRARRMWDTHHMRPGRVRVWFAGLVLASGSAGCATQSSTAQALAIAGTAAVIVGAAMASGGDCYQDPQGSYGPEVYCSPGLSKGARKAGTAIAAAGVGAAAAGYALQPKGPDRRNKAATAPRAPTQPYRLIRQTPPQPEPEPEVAAGAAPANAAPANAAAVSSPAPNSAAASSPSASSPSAPSPSAPSPSAPSPSALSPAPTLPGSAQPAPAPQR